MSKTCIGYHLRQFVALACGVVCCFGLSEAKAEWLNTNWTYRVPITVGSPMNLTDYQVKLLVNFRTGMTTNFADIRFTQSDGTSPLSYWLDRFVDQANPTTAIFWIRVPSVLSTGTVVYVYYGNTNATTSTSSGANTFGLFEGFDDNPTGQNPLLGWLTLNPLSGSFSAVVTNRGLTSLKAGYFNQSGSSRYRAYKGIGTRTGNLAWDFYAKALRNDRRQIMSLYNETTKKVAVMLKFGPNGQIGYYGNAVSLDIMPYASNRWYEFSIFNVNFAAGRFDLMVDGAVVSTNLGFYEAAANVAHITFVGDTASPGATWFDDLRIRNYAGVNPTSTFGDSETQTQNVAAVTLFNLNQTYDGTPRVVTATTDPTGLTVVVTYDGSSNAPVNAGTYAVTGTINEVNWQGSTNGTLEVAKADQTISFPTINDQRTNDTLGLSAAASSGLQVTFALLPGGPGVLNNETNLTFSDTGTVVVVASQAGDTNWNPALDVTNTFRVGRSDQLIFTNTIVSAYGTPTPGIGAHAYFEGTVVTNSVSSPDTRGSTQYVCIGWSMTSNEPVIGFTTECGMTVTNHATLTWLWTTNFLLTTAAGTGGSVNPAGTNWHSFGSIVPITATTNQYYDFAYWTGDVSGPNITANPLNLEMSGPKSVIAMFAERLATNCTPEWWLASYGLTNEGDSFNEAAMEDEDADGKAAWEEYWAGTNPTNPLSVFQQEVVSKTNATGYVINWTEGRTGSVYTVYFSTNYLASDWSILQSNLSWSATGYTDIERGASTSIWYRVSAGSPCNIDFLPVFSPGK